MEAETPSGGVRTTATDLHMGLIVNPIAGMGGRVALHGTDGATWKRAEAMGAHRISEARAVRALTSIKTKLPDVHVVTAGGPMGSNACAIAGLRHSIVPYAVGTVTTVKDTIAVAGEMLDRGVDLVVFAGGDGTARDIASVIETRLPLLGIPCGVKMHSGVFGVSPESAGQIAGEYVLRPHITPLVTVDILDVDSMANVSSALTHYAHALVPIIPNKLQRAKAVTPHQGTAAVRALCSQIAADMEPGRTYLIGPGTTTTAILDALGIEGSLSGVDIVRDGAVVISDASTTELLADLGGGRPASLILGVIGGQGFLLGHGNQQISGAVLERIAADGLTIVAGADKVAGLDPPVLHVDIDEPEQATRLTGYQRVRTGPNTTIMLKVVS